MTGGDFNGTTLVADRIVGVRGFTVVGDLNAGNGDLRGVSAMGSHYSYREGVNVATCLLDPVERVFTYVASAHNGDHDYPGEQLSISDGRFSIEHVPGQLHCSCGFYAYYTIDDAPLARQGIVGIVAGTGRVTAGQKGFRAQRAQILALVVPEPPWRGRWWGVLVYAFASAYFTTEALVDALQFTFHPGWLRGAALVLHVWLAWWCTRQWYRSRAARRNPQTAIGYWLRVDRLIRKRYPNVQIYRTVAAALRAHPLSTRPVVDQ